MHDQFTKKIMKENFSLACTVVMEELEYKIVV
jgi:hypothetical protein